MRACLIPLLGLVACAGKPTPPAPTPGARQLVVVRTADWSATTGWLQRYERTPDHPWLTVGDSIAIVVGRTGLAWGRGVRTAPESGEPVKQEGDGKSPAGEFQLGAAFGYAPPDSAGWLKVAYVQATPALQCVDDPASDRYNELRIRPAEGPAPWASAEDMRRGDEAYRWGVVVEHNSGWQRVAGGGSCIFLHVWSGPTSPTVGCTAMEVGRLVEVMRWLDAARAPVLVQLTSPVYQRLRAAWELP